MAKLANTLFRVQVDDPTLPDDEAREYLVRGRMCDATAWDRDRAKYGWPKTEDAQALWATYVTWKALRRTGEITDTFDEYEARCLSIEALDKPADVDPTPPAVTSD